ncbi:MAG: carboxynorspermidine decarboxylase, partial [Gammaproteobacteria bacterium]
MNEATLLDWLSQAPSPAYVLEEEKLLANLTVLDRVQRETGARIILALKGFAMWSVFDRIRGV